MPEQTNVTQSDLPNLSRSAVSSTTAKTLSFSNIPPPSELPAFATIIGRDSAPSLSPQIATTSARSQAPVNPTLPVPDLKPSCNTLISAENASTPLGDQSLATTKAPDQDISITVDMNYSECENLPTVQKNVYEYTPSVWRWLKNTVSNNSFLNTVASKAKDSVETVIMTLDPQMKDYLNSSSSSSSSSTETWKMAYLITSAEAELSAVRSAMQIVLKSIDVEAINRTQLPDLPLTPLGFQSALLCARRRVAQIRDINLQTIDDNQPVMTIQNFLVELHADTWFHCDCVYLNVREQSYETYIYTQLTPMNANLISHMRQCSEGKIFLPETPGFSVSVEQTISHFGINPWQWFPNTITLHRQDMIKNAAIAVASLYKRAMSNTE
ncbi:Protein PRRC1 [Trichinella pseudospiralis]|uniref:Protein PRRC1 n=1 Tax=Trichinella pseudospiralis TaxID=6337 RepID=A0A0V1J7M1_TRIPS|nr:Protein PRRC1 [Trichinella pseudospiralis]KRZ40108.1 Protein PRRC1 [Trichinella pseudospiralis]